MKLYAGFTESRKQLIEYDHDTIIYLLPVSTNTRPYDVPNNNHYRVEFFDGICRKSKCFSYKSCLKEHALNEALQYMKSYEVNKIDTVIECKVSNLTPCILKNFRFCQPKIEYCEQDVPIDPYFLGLWLGDGSSNKAAITNIDQPIIKYLEDFSTKHNIDMKQVGITYFLTGNRKDTSRHFQKMPTKDNIISIIADKESGMPMKKISDKYHISVSSIYRYLQLYNKEGINGIHQLYKQEFNIFKVLQNLNLINNKHIPIIYLKNSITIRSNILAGLIDSDGNKKNGTWEITQKNKTLSDDIVTLAKSLGFFTTCKDSWKACTNSLNPTKKELYHRIKISNNQVSLNIPVLLDRKQFNKENLVFNNPKLWFDDNIYEHVEWNDKLDDELLKAIRIYDGKTHIEWKTITENVTVFNKASPNALRAHYRMHLQKTV